VAREGGGAAGTLYRGFIIGGELGFWMPGDLIKRPLSISGEDFINQVYTH